MYIFRATLLISLITGMILIITSCSTVPKEVVELSYVTGKDMHSIYESYDKLIYQFYENLRSQRRVYLDDIWYPRFLENWRDDGELVGIAKGERIWSETDTMLVDAPPGGDPQETLNTLNDWVLFALYSYELKEERLLESLNTEEKNLRALVKKSFDRLIRANATITAHLNSLREVQEIQDEALQALDIKDLRDKINQSLVKASASAAEGLEEIRKADAKVDNFVDEIKNIESTIK